MRVVQVEAEVYKIPLTKGKFALVDKEDYDVLNQWNWFLTSSGGKEYAARVLPRPVHKQILMHRQLLGVVGKTEIDHKNGNGLDNRKVNLRKVSSQQNKWNSFKHKDNKTGFRGVVFAPHAKKFAVFVKTKNKRFFGYFKTAEEAAKKHDEVVKQEFGQFAKLNFPEKGEFNNAN